MNRINVLLLLAHGVVPRSPCPGEKTTGLRNEKQRRRPGEKGRPVERLCSVADGQPRQTSSHGMTDEMDPS